METLEYARGEFAARRRAGGAKARDAGVGQVARTIAARTASGVTSASVSMSGLLVK